METDTPESIAKAKGLGRLADPGKVVDYIEKCVSEGKTIIYPGKTRWLYLWYALAPKLWWKVVMHFEK